MFSSQLLINILHENFLKPIRIGSIQYEPTWSTNMNHLTVRCHEEYYAPYGNTFFSHEEPLEESNLIDFQYWGSTEEFIVGRNGIPSATEIWEYGIQLLANSEKSLLKRKFVRQYKMQDWYFFYHGFAALDWFNNFKYFPLCKNPTFSHLFISYNHLVTLKRNYRLLLISHLLNKNLDKCGLISAPLINDKSIWLDDLYKNKHSLLSADAKKLIFLKLNQNQKTFILDRKEVNGTLSANINIELNQKAFIHLVTETVFFEEKLHLTEKIFKPIVSGQPFMLVGAAGNLAYLKSYGFKTFDRWWDESYDTEVDNEKRILMIVNELEKLSKLSKLELYKMHQEMLDILEFNRDHFFNDFKKIIVDELSDNFKRCIDLHNYNLSERFRLPIENLDFNRIKQRLMQ